MNATYSPEDNKLRLYAETRLDPGTYERVKKAGFIWAPRQELFVAPMWTPGREDLLIDLCGEIGDEDTSLIDRAEERAERFEDYSEKRAEDAERARAAVSSIADNIPLGQPILVGHHSEKHARKDAAKIENGMRKAVNMWEQAKYWEYRAKGAVRAAKYKERPDVRARRIKGLEADKRKEEKTKKDAETFLKLWENVHDENCIKRKDGQPTTIDDRAKYIANYGHASFCFPLDKYPREAPASQYEGMMSVRSALVGGVITGEQARDLLIPAYKRTIASCNRWINHLENRLAYEKTMLGESGGTNTDQVKPEKGGACKCWASPNGGFSYIQKVNKVSVTVLDNWGNGGGNFTRNIPFDKLKGIMTAAQVQEKRSTGQLVQNANAIGFFLRDTPLQERPEYKAPERTEFDNIKDALKEGVKVVCAPQLFPTPPDIAAKMVEYADIEEGQRILEPSAGTGNLLDHLRPWIGKSEIIAVEINLSLTNSLRDRFREGIAFQCADFLNFNGNLGTFDRIIMNPPFENGADIKHIQHALTMLKPGGRLVALCANGQRQRAAFMDQAEHWEDLPMGSFKEQGTGVNVALMVLSR